MKKEYKKFNDLYYCYNSESDMTIRVDSREVGDITTYNFKLRDWEGEGEEYFRYEKLSKKEFKTALSAAIKRLKERSEERRVGKEC